MQQKSLILALLLVIFGFATTWADDDGAKHQNNNEGYNSENGESQNSNNNNKNVIIDLKFASDFEKFNPRNSDSEFTFDIIDNTTGKVRDGATFLDGKYGVLDMVDIPLGRWLP